MTSDFSGELILEKALRREQIWMELVRDVFALACMHGYLDMRACPLYNC
jgi:hypothetical protein